MIVATLIFALFLAYANGANDNFKGVATLYGSRTAGYKKALIWTTVATILGSLTALYFATELIIVFKGKGLVPESVIQMESFPVAVGLAAALTVMLATILKLPVSTTHALVGSLAGAGFMASATGINTTKLMSSFFLPLIGGPVLSLLLAVLLYPLLKRLREKMKVEPETIVIKGEGSLASFPAVARHSYTGDVFGISARKVLDILHYISGGMVSFSRGLNDTPKIAALLLIGSRFDLNFSIFAVGIVMMIGGLVHSRRIAETMGDRVTDMNPGQAFTANIVTAFMVFVASKMGVPVSTTHVSCGSIFGIGAATKQAHWDVIGKILFAWVTTLPLGFALGMGLMAVL